jgi:hypothetical protein
MTSSLRIVLDYVTKWFSSFQFRNFPFSRLLAFFITKFGAGLISYETKILSLSVICFPSFYFFIFFILNFCNLISGSI